MFIVRFLGGLGNQMFQVAFLKSLEIKYPEQKIYADLSAYKICDFHYGYELNKVFEIELPIANDDDIRRLSHYRPSKAKKYKYKILNKLSLFLGGEMMLPSKKKTEIVERDIDNICNLWGRSDNDLYFDGFWQNSKFYEPINNNIYQLFDFKQKDYQACKFQIDNIKKYKSVSIHIRRGDYVGTEFDCIPNDYYSKAIRFFNELNPNAHFFFFSDDIEYVKNKFAGLSNKTIVTGNDGIYSYRDLLLMTCCENHIIANSSFSYWGAKLCKKSGKVIAPKAFLKDKPPLAEQEWIKF